MPIPNVEEIDLMHRYMCKAVADPKRILIMYALHEDRYHVSALADLLDMPQPTVSRHLALLKQRGIVIGEREGTAVYYRLADDRIIGVLDTMHGMLRDLLEAQSSNFET